MHVPDLAYRGDERVNIAAGVELAETDPHGSFGKSPNGLVRRRGAMQSGAHRDRERLIEDRPGEGDVFGVAPL
jgi:hypothetical protein